MSDWLQSILDWYMNQMNYWSIMICMAIESSIIPFPAELIIPPAAWKAANGELNIFLVVLSGTVGAVIGALVNYLLAITLGRRLIYAFTDSRLGRLLMITREKVETSERYFLKYGAISTMIGRLTPGVRSLISIPAGLVKMPLKDFILYTFIGAGLWNCVLAVIGYFLFSKRELLHQYYSEISIVLLVLGFLFFCYLLLNKKKKINQ